ncbi:MAG: hypothetical protein ABIH38_03015 [Patescibacteria group bacterium]
MPDINLIKNTLRPEPKRKKEKDENTSFSLTHPPKEEKSPGEAKAPSSLSMFFRSFFSRKPKIESEPGIVEEKIVKKATPTPFSSSVTPYHKEENVEDIFEKDPQEKEDEPFSPPPPAAPFSKEENTEDIFKKDLIEKPSSPSPAPLSPPEPPPAINPKKEKKEKADKREDQSFLVNLLPEELVSREEPRKKIINLSLIVLGAALLVALSYFALFFYQKNLVEKTDNAKKERLAVEDQIKKREEEQKKTIELKQRIDNIKSLLGTHIYWTKFFEKLEKYTLPDVYYTGAFNASTTGTISLKATAPDFETVSQQLVVFKNAPDFIQSVSITSAQRETASLSIALPEGALLSSQVDFGVSLNLVPDIFYKTEEEIESGSTTNTNTSIEANSNVNSNTNNSVNINTSVNENINTNASISVSSLISPLALTETQVKTINSNLQLTDSEKFDDYWLTFTEGAKANDGYRIEFKDENTVVTIEQHIFSFASNEQATLAYDNVSNHDFFGGAYLSVLGWNYDDKKDINDIGDRAKYVESTGFILTGSYLLIFQKSNTLYAIEYSGQKTDVAETILKDLAALSLENYQN